MQERRGFPEAIRHMGDQKLAHPSVLGEHEGPLAGVDQLVDQLVEAGELARAPRDRAPVVEEVRRMVADLLQAGERGEHEASALHPVRAFGLVEEVVEYRLVEAGLLGR